jgi:DNA-binding response OmpR family regulator
MLQLINAAGLESTVPRGYTDGRSVPGIVGRKQMRIGLLEDDDDVARLMETWLKSAGHHVYHFARGGDCISALQRESFDLLILDWLLPDINGDEVLVWVRENVGWNVPVIFITQRDSQEDIVAALNKGADDYMTKPVGSAELLARIGALARRVRGGGEEGRILLLPPYELDFQARRIKCDGEDVTLTKKEYDLAAFLFRHAGELLSRAHILEAVWGRKADVTTRTVDIHISRLRKKLNFSDVTGWRLNAIYHHGYRLEPVGDKPQ